MKIGLQREMRVREEATISVHMLQIVSNKAVMCPFSMKMKFWDDSFGDSLIPSVCSDPFEDLIGAAGMNQSYN